MAYATNLSLQNALRQFDLKYLGSDLVFPTVLPALPPAAADSLDFLNKQLVRDADIARRNASDQAKSAFVIAPVLATLRQIHRVGLHMGVNFAEAASGNEAANCDFLLTLSDELEIIEAPVLVVVQAKQSVMAEGVGRCVDPVGGDDDVDIDDRFGREAGDGSAPDVLDTDDRHGAERVDAENRGRNAVVDSPFG